MSSIRMRRRLIAGALAAVAVAAPAALTAATGAAESEVTAAPRCLAWFGNKEDGKCLSYSNGQPVVGGMPAIGIGGPGSSSPGIYTGPLLPGTTITQPIG
ncbi:putative uncharacterized protein [Mycolicibacterium thermoresistibile]|nr:putative uncharacterized protein [Mycolicibacterium thermoresistibile]